MISHGYALKRYWQSVIFAVLVTVRYPNKNRGAFNILIDGSLSCVLRSKNRSGDRLNDKQVDIIVRLMYEYSVIEDFPSKMPLTIKVVPIFLTLPTRSSTHWPVLVVLRVKDILYVRAIYCSHYDGTGFRPLETIMSENCTSFTITKSNASSSSNKHEEYQNQNETMKI